MFHALYLSQPAVVKELVHECAIQASRAGSRGFTYYGRAVAVNCDQAEPPEIAQPGKVRNVGTRESEPNRVNVAFPALRLSNSSSPVVQFGFYGCHVAKPFTWFRNENIRVSVALDPASTSEDGNGVTNAAS